MSNLNVINAAGVALLGLGLLVSSAQGRGLVNGGFESGFTGWTLANQLGSDGSFAVQSGTASPVNAFTVPAPVEGGFAAMTDSTAGGSHVLYQDFIIPTGPITLATIDFSLFLRNGAAAYSNPANLNWSTPQLNQQARVDLMVVGADAFSVSAADVLLNLFQTTTATPLLTGYNAFSVDVTSLLSAHAGETVRLRFAQVDNVNFFNLGVDAVSVNVVPSPAVSAFALAAVAGAARRRRDA
jgi:hypothetical protein